MYLEAFLRGVSSHLKEDAVVPVGRLLEVMDGECSLCVACIKGWNVWPLKVM